MLPFLQETLSLAGNDLFWSEVDDPRQLITSTQATKSVEGPLPMSTEGKSMAHRYLQEAQRGRHFLVSSKRWRPAW